MLPAAVTVKNFVQRPHLNSVWDRNPERSLAFESVFFSNIYYTNITTKRKEGKMEEKWTCPAPQRPNKPTAPLNTLAVDPKLQDCSVLQVLHWVRTYIAVFFRTKKQLSHGSQQVYVASATVARPPSLDKISIPRGGRTVQTDTIAKARG